MEANDTFTRLKYGSCECGNPGTEIESCSYTKQSCNCCIKCRRHCVSMKANEQSMLEEWRNGIYHGRESSPMINVEKRRK